MSKRVSRYVIQVVPIKLEINSSHPGVHTMSRAMLTPTFGNFSSDEIEHGHPHCNLNVRSGSAN